MKKKSIQLVVLVGVLVLLLAGYFILTSVTGGEDDTVQDSDTAAQTYTVCTVDRSTVSKIAYTYGGSEYVYTLKTDSTGWEWSENPALPLDNSYFAAMVTAFTELTSTVKLTDITAEQLAEYGLSDSADTVCFTDGVSGVRTYRMGIRNSFNGKLYFCCESDLGTVYMVDASLPDAFAYTAYDMIQKDSLPTDLTKSGLMRVTLTPAAGSAASTMVYTYYVGGKEGVDAEDVTDVWYVSRNGGEEVKLDAETGAALSTALTTLAFSQVEGYTEGDKVALGLDTPTKLTLDYKVTTSFEDSTTGKVTNVVTDRSFTLLLGNIADSGLCYATLEDTVLSYTLMGTVFADLLRATAAQ